MDDAATRLAADLREAFARLGASDLPATERARLHRRLLAVTDAAKHDTERARTRLQRWLDDLEAAETP